MSDYSKTTDFTSKDTLAAGNPAKTIKGSDFDLELGNVATASATKANKVLSATNNNLLTMDANGDLQDSAIATNGTDTITADLVGDVTGTADTATNATTAANLSGSNLTGDVSNIANAMSVDSVQADAVDTAGVQDDAVTSPKIGWTIGTNSTQSVGTGGWLIPEGLVNWVRPGTSAAIYLEINDGATWRRGEVTNSGSCWSDGTNMRLITASGSDTVYYQVLA